MSEEISDDKNTLLGMPLLGDAMFSVKKVLDRLRDHWRLDFSSDDACDGSKDDTCVLHIDGMVVAISCISAQVPLNEVESLIPINMLWKNAEQEIPQHKAHVIVYASGGDIIERFTLWTKVIESILECTNSLGVYLGMQTLLIGKDVYIDMAQNLLEDAIPVMLWVYVRTGRGENGNSIYTYGLNAFDKLEIEVVDCKLEMEELFDYVLNICSYVIENDVTFKTGETLGYTEDIAARISISEGVYLEGQTIKLNFE